MLRARNRLLIRNNLDCCPSLHDWLSVFLSLPNRGLRKWYIVMRCPISFAHFYRHINNLSILLPNWLFPLLAALTIALLDNLRVLFPHIRRWLFAQSKLAFCHRACENLLRHFFVCLLPCQQLAWSLRSDWLCGDRLHPLKRICMRNHITDVERGLILFWFLFRFLWLLNLLQVLHDV